MKANRQVGLQFLSAPQDRVGPGDVDAVDRDHAIGGRALMHGDGGSRSLEEGQEFAWFLIGVDIGEREPLVKPASDRDQHGPCDRRAGSTQPAIATPAQDE